MKTTYAMLDGKLLLGTQPCLACAYTSHPGAGVRYPGKPCDNCKGTTRRSGRRCRRCPGADGLPSGRVPDLTNPLADGPCPRCGGSAEVPATRMSHLDLSEWDVPIVIIAQDSGRLGNPELRIDSLYSTRDYGRAWESYNASSITTMERITSEVRKDLRYVQACKVSERDGTLCDRLAVYLAREGYIVLSERAQPTENILEGSRS